MKNIFLTMTAIAALGAAIPAVAQSSHSVSFNGGIENRIERLDARLEAGVREGAITRREAWPLRMQLRELNQLERRYGANGFSARENSDLQRRLRTLRRGITAADGGGEGRYDRDDGYGADIRIGYDNRHHDGNRGSILDRLVDGITGNGRLEVGQRASANLDAVPSQYRRDYRDTRNVYYRADGRTIYEIDARTHLVARVYPIDR